MLKLAELEYIWGTDYSRMSDEDINNKIYEIVSSEIMFPDDYDLLETLSDLLDMRRSSIDFDEASYDAYQKSLLNEELEDLDYIIDLYREDTKYYDL